MGSADRSVCKAAGALSCAVFGSSVSASCAGSHARWLNHTFACAVRRCLLDGIPGVRLPGSAVYPRSRSLRTSRGPGGYAVTPALGGRGLHPHGKLSYKVHLNLAVFLGTKVPFRPTGRTYIFAESSRLYLRNCSSTSKYAGERQNTRSTRVRRRVNIAGLLSFRHSRLASTLV